MKYQALYRAYRPRKFSDMVGQAHITKTIQNAIIQDKVSHAYLFSGPRGTGKTTTAKIIAKAINCLNGPSIEPCNECDVCRGIDSGEITDVIEIDAASNNGVDEIREIRDKVKYAPTVAKYKVYIIDEVHMLSTGAFNALLKTLEEPPKHVIFILATTEPHKIPLTIISRCQRFDFKKISVSEIVKRLKTIIEIENVNVEEQALTLVAKISDGGMRDALSLLDQAISYADDLVTVDDVHSISGTVSMLRLEELTLSLLNKDTAQALQLINAFNDEGKDVVRLTEDLIFYLRDLLLYMHVPKIAEDKNTLLFSELSNELLTKINDSLIYNGIEVLNNTLNEMKYTNHPKVFLDLAIIKLSRNIEVIKPQNNVSVSKESSDLSTAGGIKSNTSDEGAISLSDFLNTKKIKEENIQKIEVITPKIEDSMNQEPITHSLIETSDVGEEDKEEELLPPEGQVSIFGDVFSSEQQVEVEDTKEEPQESLEEEYYEYVLDVNAYLSKVKDIRINNALALANKEILDTVHMKWESIILYSTDPRLGPIASLLMDSNARVASENILIISFTHESIADRCNQQLSEVEQFVCNLLGRNVKIIAISDVDWLKIRDEYIMNKRRGVKYVPFIEPSEDEFMKKVKKTRQIEPQSEVKNEDPIVLDAINLFGSDIVEIE